MVVCVALFVSAACESSAELYVDVRSDYRSGIDFTLVQIRRGEETVALARADMSGDFRAGVRVARLPASELGAPVILAVELLDRDHDVIAGRTVQLARAPSRTAAITVLLTRTCAEVTCPAENVAATECLVGRCVPPDCLDSRTCAPPECETDGDCPVEPGSCVSSRCDDGACIATPDDAQCVSPAVCSVASARCVVPPSRADAGPPDASVLTHANCYRRAYAGHEYLFCTEAGVSDEMARRTCTQLGFELVRIDDAAEEQWVVATATELGAPRSVRMEGSDRAVEGEWRLDDGTLFWRGTPQNGRYVNWGPGEPTDASPEEDCVELWIVSVETGWHDATCGRLIPFVCEAR